MELAPCENQGGVLSNASNNVDGIILTLDHNPADVNIDLTNTNQNDNEDRVALEPSLVTSDCGHLFLVTYDNTDGKPVSAEHCINLQISTNELLKLKYNGNMNLLQPEGNPNLTQDSGEIQTGDALQLAVEAMRDASADEDQLELVSHEVKQAALEAMIPQRDACTGRQPYSCGLCSKMFIRRYELKSHLSRHFGMNVFLCPVCGKQFSHPSNLVRHVRIHTGSKPYKCVDCGKRFNQANSLHTHRAALHVHVTEGRKFICPLCDRSYKTCQLLKRHCRISHRNQDVDLNSLLTQQQQQHSNVPTGRRFYCSHCGLSFAKLSILKSHKQEHDQDAADESTREPQPKLQINLDTIGCMLKEFQKSGSASLSGTNYVAHTLHPDGTTPSFVPSPLAHIPALGSPAPPPHTPSVAIPSVSSSLATTSWSEHVKYADTIEDVVRKVNSLICFECGRQFQRYISYKQHWGVHETSLRRYQCAECGMTFAWKSTYTKHVAQHSTTDEATSRWTSCTQSDCDRRYRSVGQMQEHVKRDHLLMRRFGCDQCEKSFYKAHDLTVHQRTHSKEKPYLCGTCGKCFSHLSHVIRHERCHSDSRPYTCPVCQKTFSQAAVLKIHRQRKCPDESAHSNLGLT